MIHLKNTKKDHYSTHKYPLQWGLFQCAFCGKVLELPNINGKAYQSCGCKKGSHAGRPVFYNMGCLHVCVLLYDVIVSITKPDDHNDHLACAYIAVDVWRNYCPT